MKSSRFYNVVIPQALLREIEKIRKDRHMNKQGIVIAMAEAYIAASKQKGTSK